MTRRSQYNAVVRRILLILCGLVSISSWACSSKPPGEERYSDEVAAARAAKDSQFAAAADSPVPADKRSVFLPLSYFPIDSAYSVPASLEEAPPGNRPVVQFETSRRELRMMERVGVLKFSLKGQPLQLAAFVEQGENGDRLFLPFSDTTAGSETYRGGRYLDIHRTATGIYLLDFNRAYNPYCYYNPTYDCPLPPRENRLPIPVLAGEKIKLP